VVSLHPEELFGRVTGKVHPLFLYRQGGAGKAALFVRAQSPRRVIIFMNSQPRAKSTGNHEYAHGNLVKKTPHPPLPAASSS
jgi:hypothetical protein